MPSLCLQTYTLLGSNLPLKPAEKLPHPAIIRRITRHTTDAKEGVVASGREERCSTSAGPVHDLRSGLMATAVDAPVGRCVCVSHQDQPITNMGVERGVLLRQPSLITITDVVLYNYMHGSTARPLGA